MSETLHTKYRPTTLDEVIGQDTVVGAFGASIRKKSSQAYLFNGPTGTGKTTLARIGATMLKCKPRDILELDAATHTGIDDMRAITQSLLYPPFGQGSKRAIIIDECHGLSKASWNSLLKSIEEPPSWCVWFFCTTELGKVLPTVKSRCTTFELKPVANKELYELVKFVAEAEGIFPNKKAGAGEGIMELCAKEARGSPRQALVNLGAVADCADRPTAASLLKSVVDLAEPVALAKLLLTRGNWTQAQRILNDIKDENPESVRRVIAGYLSAVILGAQSEKVAGTTLMLLEEFITPLSYSDDMSPIVMAVGRLVLRG